MRKPLLAIVILALGIAGAVGIWITSPLRSPVPTPDKFLDEFFMNTPSKETLKAEAKERCARIRKSCVEEYRGNEICRVHYEPLRPDAVMVYGGGLPPKLSEASKLFFPNSNKVFLSDDNYRTRLDFDCVLYCASCRKAESEWRKLLPEKPRPEEIPEEED